MKTVEELKGMTQEDLVCLVQELQEKIQGLNEDKEFWLDQYRKEERKYNLMLNAHKAVINML